MGVSVWVWVCGYVLCSLYFNTAMNISLLGNQNHGLSSLEQNAGLHYHCAAAEVTIHLY